MLMKISKISYPTKCIVENFLTKIFDGLTNYCLSQSINTIGFNSDCHNQPGAMGVLPITVNSITGVDIPFMINDNKNDKGTVAIIAQDPLRNSNDPMLAPFSPFFANPIVGTPFAIHYEEAKYPQTNVYRLIIDGLLNKGYDVYVTDVWKCWDKNSTFRRSKWNANNLHFQCLLDEFASIMPKYVILMGNVANTKINNRVFLQSLYNSFSIIKTIHPSGAANRAWAKILPDCQADKKADYILNLIP